MLPHTWTADEIVTSFPDQNCQIPVLPFSKPLWELTTMNKNDAKKETRENLCYTVGYIYNYCRFIMIYIYIPILNLCTFLRSICSSLDFFSTKSTSHVIRGLAFWTSIMEALVLRRDRYVKPKVVSRISKKRNQQRGLPLEDKTFMQLVSAYELMEHRRKTRSVSSFFSGFRLLKWMQLD